MTLRKFTRQRSMALLALLAVPLVASAQGGFSGAGRYEIANLKSGKVLDLDRNDQTTVIQFSSRGTDNQTWQIEQAGSGFFYIRNGMNGYALEPGGNNNSAPVRGVPYNGSPNQQWRIESGKDGNAMIVNRNGKTLDIPDGTDRDGVRVQMYDRNGDSNQRFLFRRASGGGRNWGGNSGWGNRNNQGGWGNNNNQQAATLTCSSDNGSRVYCNANTNGGVQMTRQISGSPCREGETWGWDNRGIWVDRGCRAEFQTGVGGGNNNNGRGWGFGRNNNRNNNTTVVTCVSNRGRRVYCSADGNGSVRLVRQTGNQACIEGSTWGRDDRGIWVDRGCAGEFEVRR